MNINLELIAKIEQGDIEAIKQLLQKDADPAGEHAKEIYHALKESGHPNITNLIIDAVNTPNEHGLCPLHSAVICHDHKRVQNLILLGAHPLKEDARGKSPIDYLSGKMKKYSAIKSLLTDAEHKELLFASIHEGLYESVEKLIDDYLGISDPEDIYGRTLLQSALNAETFDIEIFELLLAKGALISATLLDQIALLDDEFQSELKELLLKYIDHQNKHGLTPLHRAVIRDNMDSVLGYLELGANENLTNIKDNNGNTPFYYATREVAKHFNSKHTFEANLLLEDIIVSSEQEPQDDQNHSQYSEEDCDALLQEMAEDSKKTKDKLDQDNQAALLNVKKKPSITGLVLPDIESRVQQSEQLPENENDAHNDELDRALQQLESNEANCNSLFQKIEDVLELAGKQSTLDYQRVMFNAANQALDQAEIIAQQPNQTKSSRALVMALVGVAFGLIGGALLLSPMGPLAAAALVTQTLMTANVASTAVATAAWSAVTASALLEVTATRMFFGKPNKGDHQNGNPLPAIENNPFQPGAL